MVRTLPHEDIKMRVTTLALIAAVGFAPAALAQQSNPFQLPSMPPPSVFTPPPPPTFDNRPVRELWQQDQDRVNNMPGNRRTPSGCIRIGSGTYCN
jgi:hypothetical protein